MKIHTLDQLEKDIYRLRLEAKNMESQINDNLHYLQKHYTAMAVASFISSFSMKEKRGESSDDHLFSNIFKMEAIDRLTSRMADRLIDKAAEGIENLVGGILHKK
jgi:ribonucleotide reductase beta subunit family protein with ferritin-like domain